MGAAAPIARGPPVPLSHSQRSTLWGLAAVLLVIGLVTALLTMDDDSTFLDAIPFGPARSKVAAPAVLPEDQLPIDTFVPSAILQLSPQDALARNLALPLSHASNPMAPPFVAAWLGADLERQTVCLANAVYYEASGEPLSGQRAVAQVVLNRLRHPRYPKTICEVVNQGSERPTGCQFSFTCDGSMARTPNPARWKVAMGVATAALDGWTSAEAGQATHYHTLYVFPKWAPELLKLGILGHHIFYRLPGQPHDYAAFRAAAAALPTDPALLAPTLPDPALPASDIDTRAVAGAPLALPAYPGPTVTGTDGSAATPGGGSGAGAGSGQPAPAPTPAPTATPTPRNYFPDRRSTRSHLPLPQ
jgi:hypothetical protein